MLRTPRNAGESTTQFPRPRRQRPAAVAKSLRGLLVAIVIMATVLFGAGEAASQTPITCALYPVYPSSTWMHDDIPNARLNGGDGLVKLWLIGPSVQEATTAAAPHIARFVAADTQVDEVHTDMGVWTTNGNKRWMGECFRNFIGFQFVKPVEYLGRYVQLEPPVEEFCEADQFVDDPFSDPVDPCPSGGGGGGAGTTESGSSTLDDCPFEYVCVDLWDGTQWVEFWCGNAYTCT